MTPFLMAGSGTVRCSRTGSGIRADTHGSLVVQRPKCPHTWGIDQENDLTLGSSVENPNRLPNDVRLFRLCGAHGMCDRP